MSGQYSSDTLWVLARVQDTIFALDSSHVDAISQQKEAIPRTPGSDSVNVSVIPFRGVALPILDLRGLLGLRSRDDELQDMQDMMDTRKTDHIHWVAELGRCAHDHTEFGLARDPYSCAFGKWFYSYKPKNQSLEFYLKQIEEPHRKLHETAEEVLSHSQRGDESGADTILSKETEVYKGRVLQLLDQAKAAFIEESHQMMVVVSDASRSCGLLLDEVMAVELLDLDAAQQSAYDGNIVSCVARRPGSAELVLVLDLERIWSYA